MTLLRRCPVGCPFALSPTPVVPLWQAGFSAASDGTPLPVVNGVWPFGGGRR